MNCEPRIYALEIGRRTAQIQNFVYQSEELDPGASLEIGYYFWCLQYGDSAVLVDVGFDPEEADARGLTGIRHPLEQLAKIGVEPEQVSVAILTHLHWDHAGGLDFFPKARVWAPKKDVELYNSPAMGHPMVGRYVRPRDLELLNQALDQGRVEMVHGDREVVPGVAMHWVGGHTPGTHFVSIATATGRMVLASDLVSLYRNIKQNEVPGIFQNLLESLEGIQRIKQTASSPELVIPAHDLEIAQRFSGEGPGIIRLN